MSSHTAPTSAVRPWALAFGAATLAALVVGLVVAAFVWPAATSTAKDLPVAVAGPPAAVESVARTLDQAAPGRFDLVTVHDRDAALQAVEDRDVYGAVVLGEAPEVLTASAAGAAPQQAMARLADQLGAALQGQQGSTDAARAVTVTDVAPLAADDPQGTGLNAAAFPLVMGGMIGGIVVALLVRGRAQRVTALVAYAVLAGAVTTVVLHTWFGILQGDALTEAGVFALSFLATGSVIAGLASLVGPPGIGVGAVLTMLVANPISGAAQPREFLPGAWGDIGQYFVPGASSTLLRSVSYFPDASVAAPILVLTAWAAAGLALVLLGRRADLPREASDVAAERPETAYAAA